MINIIFEHFVSLEALIKLFGQHVHLFIHLLNMPIDHMFAALFSPQQAISQLIYLHLHLGLHVDRKSVSSTLEQSVRLADVSKHFLGLTLGHLEHPHIHFLLEQTKLFLEILS